MTKFSLSGLSTFITLLALVGFHPNARADFDPTDPFASVTISPTPGAIDDITKLQNITISIPTEGQANGDAYITRFNNPTSLNKIIIRKVEGDSFTTVGNSRYNAPVAVDTQISMDC